MIIKFDNVNLNIETPPLLSHNKTYIFFLHGFTGSSMDWNNIIPFIDKSFIPISIDIIGHGKSDCPDDLNYYKTNSLIEQIKKVTEYFTKERFTLCGYSMGGRLALSFAIKYPGLLKGLILESSTYGIKDETERELRRKQDKELTEFIKTHSIDEFVEHWLNKELFDSLKKLHEEKLNKIKNEKRKNKKIGLINLLFGFGTGSMPCLYDELKSLTVPTLLITGEFDQKFSEINKEMEKELPNAKHSIINNAGHNTHQEKPEEFITSVNNFLLNSKQSFETDVY
ncbi:MAG: 2-succinyl-6-hydroxy-2,4-cyclohexadiene-1-carboxylate synthase [Bacteroidetes bacterium]|nr:2-succinyl-6-hydroxy-2,4-cyclohexadiene-1-carboxylate synthase [Bacteroidota bacterium]